MSYEIETKDGIVIRGIPDNIPPDHPSIKAKVANARFRQNAANPDYRKAGEMATDGGGTLSIGPIDTGVKTSTNIDRFTAGAGKTMTDIVRGAGQMLGLVDQPSIDEAKRRDAPLMSTGAGMAGGIVGGVATGLPSMLIPGANTVVGAGLTGAVLGGMQPVATGESRLTNTVLGGGGGVAGQLAGQAIARVLHPVRSNLSREGQRLLTVAKNEGIPLDAAASTGSKTLRNVNAVLENLPLTAGNEASKTANRQAAFTAAVLRRAGVVGDSADPATLLAQKNSLGSTFENIATRNQIDFNQGPVMQQLTDAWQLAGRRLAKPGTIQNTIDDILSDVSPGGVLPGVKYQGWRSELNKLARGDDYEAHLAKQVKKALDDAFTSQVGGSDAQLWRQASRQYANLKTILRAQGGAGVLPNEGTISPAQLSQALANAVGREGKALGRGDLNDLARVGQLFVRSPVPDSGSAQRLFYQSLLTGGGLTGAYLDPERAPIYLGAAGASLAAPRLAQMLLNSSGGQQYLSQGLVQLTPQQRAMINALTRSGGAAVPLAYTAQQQ